MSRDSKLRVDARCGHVIYLRMVRGVVTPIILEYPLFDSVFWGGILLICNISGVANSAAEDAVAAPIF